ncbi:ribbon-helix-helix protein, CopG family [Sphingomonas koreensis]|nr:ribbon-helix-helix protein, CopG family [Sphingomonas koreensis]
MSKTTVITARIDPEVAADLDKLANHQDRSRAWLVCKAIERYVREESEFFAFLKEGDDAIERGESLTQEEMEAWFLSRHEAADAA